ncbi:MAG: DUF2804 domain-containing protein [Bdellovibrionota bacterium]
MTASVPYLTHERELTEPVNLCLPDGKLNPEAVGWSRRPVQRCNLSGSWGRKKRWDFWCMTSPECALQFTYANLDYFGLASVALTDFETHRFVEHAAIVPFGSGFKQPEKVGGWDISFDRMGLKLNVREEKNGTRFGATFRNIKRETLEADVFIEYPKNHETLSVVIPWSDSRFQFTSKHNTLPASGYVKAKGRRYEFAQNSYGCLDYGRGLWPYKTVWNWGSASGTSDEKTVGLQLGGKWTDGTGMTENALCVDGRLHKLGEDLVWEYDRKDLKNPWRITAPKTRRVDLTFRPLLTRSLKLPLLVAGAELHMGFGHFSGTVLTDERKPVHVEKLLGWAEEFTGRW